MEKITNEQAIEIKEVLQAIVNDWVGEGSFATPPEFKKSSNGADSFSYYTPAGKIVKAELIAKAIELLKKIKT